MKKLLFYGLIIIVFSALGFLIYLDQTHIELSIITIDAAYTIMDDEPSIEIPIYMSGHDHPLIHEETIEYLSISHVDDHIKMAVELKEIIYRGNDIYLNKMYDLYVYQLNLPSTDQTIMIDEAILSIQMINGISYDLSIGKISISPSKPLYGHLDWSHLSGIKIDQTIYERVGCVEIGIFELKDDIKGFFDGFTYSEKFQIKDDVLYLYIDDESFLFQSFPIEIIFKDGSSQMIPYFTYMNTYQLLSVSGPIIHHYDFNPAL